MSGYTALRSKAAWIDLTSRGKLSVRGPDRVRIVHALTTNDIKALGPGWGCYAFFLNAQGKILGDANIFSHADEILLDTEPEARTALFDHVDQYIIADDATVVDVTAGLRTLSIEGPEAIQILQAVGAPVPNGRYEIADWSGGLVARANTTGQPGFLLFVPEESWSALIPRVETAGAVEATAKDAKTVRIENGKPRYGEEITARYLAPEVGRDDAIHPRKGCYLGQEVVERVRSRGLLGRVLVPVRFDTPEPPDSGTKLFAGDTRAGEVASSVYSPEFARSVGLAYVRLDAVRAGAILTCGSGTVQVHLCGSAIDTDAHCSV
jgi:folate-binding protein YgfZ